MQPLSPTPVATVEDNSSSDEETEYIDVDLDWDTDENPSLNVLKEIKPELYQCKFQIVYKEALICKNSNK